MCRGPDIHNETDGLPAFGGPAFGGPAFGGPASGGRAGSGAPAPAEAFGGSATGEHAGHAAAAGHRSDRTSSKLPQGGAVERAHASETEGAPAFPTASSESLPLSFTTPEPETRDPEPDLASSDHSAASSPPLPRRAVPLTFTPIINDEANILGFIAAAEYTVSELAIRYETTVNAFCLWLQREDVQQKLSNLSTAGTTLTRIGAMNQLPKAVKAMAAQLDGYELDRAHILIKPGLAADKVAAQRDANIRKAANLLLRLARFDPNQPVYRRRERAASQILPQQGEAAAQRPEEARSPVADGGAVERSETEGALLLPSAAAPQSDILSLCSTALSAIADSRFADAAIQGRGWRGNREVPLPFEHAEASNGSVPPATQAALPVEHSNGIHHFEPHDDPPHLNGHAKRNGRAPPRTTSWL